MNIFWRKSAIESLLKLDQWRETIELPSLATHLKDTIHAYFEKQDSTLYIPGRQVVIHGLSVALRMVLTSVEKVTKKKHEYRPNASINHFIIPLFVC